jgi:hypothetical protein
MNYYEMLLLLDPHVDAVKFSGGVVAALSLESSRVLRLQSSRKEAGFRKDEVPVCIKDYPDVAEFLILPRSLYIMQGKMVMIHDAIDAPHITLRYVTSYLFTTGVFRYEYSHSILGKRSPPSQCFTNGELVNHPPGRRISLMFRDAAD